MLARERRPGFREADARATLADLGRLTEALDRYVRRRAPATASLLPD